MENDIENTNHNIDNDINMKSITVNGKKENKENEVDVLPNNTLYVNNLNEKTKVEGNLN
jgi:hypothetical protein